MSIQSWATKARSSTYHQSPESQRLIEIFQVLLESESTPDESAHNVSALLSPLIKKDPNDLRAISVWGILCDAVRHVGSDQIASRRIIAFLACITNIQVKDGHGNNMKHEWGGRFWADLPTFALTFREYGISLDPDEDMDINDWVSQKSSYLNATSFAAMCLVENPKYSGMAFYIKDCFRETLEGPYKTPELRFRASLYVPAISAWISIAGVKIYEMCKDEVMGFNMGDWNKWENGLGHVVGDDQVDEEVRSTAISVKDKMEDIRKGV